MTTATQKTAAKKRGGYNFTDAAPSATQTKNTVKRNVSSAKKIRAKTTTASKKNLDLGLASISKTAHTASRTTANATAKGTKALQGAYANAASSAKQFQEKASTYSQKISQNLSESANKASQTAAKSLAIHRETAEAAKESYSLATNAAKKASKDVFGFFNELFAQNVQAARSAMECKNVSDFFELQSATIRNNIESTVEQAIKISENAIKSATEAFEPLKESVTKSSKKLSALVSN